MLTLHTQYTTHNTHAFAHTQIVKWNSADVCFRSCSSAEKNTHTIHTAAEPIYFREICFRARFSSLLSFQTMEYGQRILGFFVCKLSGVVVVVAGAAVADNVSNCIFYCGRTVQSEYHVRFGTTALNRFNIFKWI